MRQSCITAIFGHEIRRTTASVDELSNALLHTMDATQKKGGLEVTKHGRLTVWKKKINKNKKSYKICTERLQAHAHDLP
jgi:hypothetical protein